MVFASQAETGIRVKRRALREADPNVTAVHPEVTMAPVKEKSKWSVISSSQGGDLCLKGNLKCL